MILSDEKLRKYAEIAISQSKKHDFFELRKQRHVSLILYKGKLVSIGVNAFKTHPFANEIGYRFSEVHSEVDAFIRCPHRKKLTLLNFRINKAGHLRNSFPCELCLPWVLSVFDTVYYSTNENNMEMILPSFSTDHKKIDISTR